jgi:hypothetical protein
MKKIDILYTLDIKCMREYSRLGIGKQRVLKRKRKKSLQREIEAEKRTKKKKGSCYQGSHVPIAKKRMKHNETKEIRKKLCREKSHGDRHRSSMKKEHRSKQEDNTPAQAHQ